MNINPLNVIQNNKTSLNEINQLKFVPLLSHV
jgi:hypothetical protein